MSYHGGCDVIEGTKWAANNWINAGADRETDFEVWDQAKLVEEDFMENMKRYPWEEQTCEKENDRAIDTQNSNEQPVIN